MSKYFYSVRDGDTLPIIAQKFVNNPNRWPEIVQQNLSHYPTKLVNLSGQITPVFTELNVGQRLYLPSSWLGVNSSREQIDAIKNYGYSYDIYRFDSNPRIVYHDMPFDYLLVQKIFGCRNVNQFNQNPYRRGEDQRTCSGEPGMYTYFGYDKRLKELWGANLDKDVVQINRRFGQDHPFQTLEMKAGDIIKIPADWPDYQQCGNDDFVDIDNISKYVVPLTDGTDKSTSIKLYLSRRHSAKNQFWTADRNQTDFTALDVSDFMTRDRDSVCKCCGGDDCSCNCQRPIGTTPFLGQAVNMGDLGQAVNICDLGQATNTGDIQIVKADFQTGELVLTGDGADIIATCARETVADIQSKPEEYKRLMDKYGSDDALAEAIVQQCKELNKDLIAGQDQGDNKESSKLPLVLFSLGLAGILGTIVVLIGKEETKKVKYGY